MKYLTYENGIIMYEMNESFALARSCGLSNFFCRKKKRYSSSSSSSTKYESSAGGIHTKKKKWKGNLQQLVTSWGGNRSDICSAAPTWYRLHEREFIGCSQVSTVQRQRTSVLALSFRPTCYSPGNESNFATYRYRVSWPGPPLKNCCEDIEHCEKAHIVNKVSRINTSIQYAYRI